MSAHSTNSLENTDPNKKKSKSSLFFLPSTRSQKSATMSSIQLSQASQLPNANANPQEEPKHIIYPSPTSGYQPNKCPPDLSIAMKHRIAHGIAPLESLLTSTEICESTGVPFTTRKIPLWSSIERIYHLGPVFPMYFLLIKQISVMALFLLVLGVAIVLLQLKSDAPSSYGDYIEILYGNELQTTVLVMGTLCIQFALFFLLHKYRRQQKSTKMSCKGGNLSASDYTLMSSNLADGLNEDEIKSFFSNFIVPGYSLDVRSVNKTYDIDRYVWEIRKLVKLINKKQEKIGKLKEEGNSKEMMKIEDIDRQIEDINKFFNRRKTFLANFNLIKKNHICFVTFNTRQEAKVVKRRFELSPVQRFFVQVFHSFLKDVSEYYLSKKFIMVQKAPEPSEIIWENIRKPNRPMWFYALYAVTCIGIMVVTGYGLWQLTSTDGPYNAWYIGLVVAATNELLSYTVSFFGFWGTHLMITDKQISQAYLVMFLQLVNMIIPIYSMNFAESNFDPDGLPLYLLDISIVSFALPLFIRLINPRYVIKCLLRLKAQLQVPKCPLTQEKANQLFEDPEINISALYADLLKILMFSCFSFSVSPGTSLVALVACGFMHWIDKYNLLRRSLIPSYMRSELAEAMNECLEIALFLLAIGNLFWCFILRRYVLTISDEPISDGLTIMLGTSVFETALALIYMLLPNKRLNRAWGSLQKKDTSWSSNLFYQQAAEYFPGNYNLCSLLPELNIKPEEMRSKYKKTIDKFNCIDMLVDCPELLPLFEYADSHPSFFEDWMRNLEGLKRPYYIYPQNYGYGLVQLIALNSNKKSGNKIPLLQESDLQMTQRKTEIMNYAMRKPIDNSPFYVHRHKRETRDLVNMMTEMVSTMQQTGSARQKASTLFTPRIEEISEDNLIKNRQDSSAMNTLIFDSVKTEVIIEETTGSLNGEKSILGVSPITEVSLMYNGEKTPGSSLK